MRTWYVLIVALCCGVLSSDPASAQTSAHSWNLGLSSTVSALRYHPDPQRRWRSAGTVSVRLQFLHHFHLEGAHTWPLNSDRHQECAVGGGCGRNPQTEGFGLRTIGFGLQSAWGRWRPFLGMTIGEMDIDTEDTDFTWGGYAGVSVRINRPLYGMVEYRSSRVDREGGPPGWNHWFGIGLGLQAR